MVNKTVRPAPCLKCHKSFNLNKCEHTERAKPDNPKPGPAPAYFKVYYVCPFCGHEQRHHIEGPY